MLPVRPDCSAPTYLIPDLEQPHMVILPHFTCTPTPSPLRAGRYFNYATDGSLGQPVAQPLGLLKYPPIPRGTPKLPFCKPFPVNMP